MILTRLSQLPIILEVGECMLKDLDLILEQHSLIFSKKTLLTYRELYDLYPDFCSGFKHVEYVENSNVSHAGDIIRNLGEADLLIGFGGGVVLDITKYVATKKNINYLAIPTALSNDGIYSPVASLKHDDGLRESIGVNVPLGIVIDLEIIKKAPVWTLRAGIGDLISNISSLSDWKIAKKANNEHVDDFSYTLANLATHSVFDSQTIELDDIGFIKKVAYSLVLSGLAMELAKSSRPCSGAEHLISHSLDRLFPDRHTLHGLQVAYATYYLEEMRGGKYKTRLESFYQLTGLPLTCEELGFSNDEFNMAVKMAPSLRDRFTVLNT